MLLPQCSLAGEDRPTLNVVFTYDNGQFLHIMPFLQRYKGLLYFCDLSSLQGCPHGLELWAVADLMVGCQGE